MAEYIEREKAIHAARYTTPMMPSQSLAIANAIESITAADVRPVKRGKWNREFGLTCSVCGHWVSGSDEYECAENFCPNCGADMRQEPPNEKLPDIRVGKWSRVDYKPCGHDYVCSECGNKNDRASNYCPDCGADMMEES